MGSRVRICIYAHNTEENEESETHTINGSYVPEEERKIHECGVRRKRTLETERNCT